jgi:hypothetical protein
MVRFDRPIPDLGSELHRDEIEAGLEVVADRGFPCIAAGTTLTVQAVPDRLNLSRFYVRCARGRHFLIGQIDDAGFVTGFRKSS